MAGKHREWASRNKGTKRADKADVSNIQSAEADDALLSATQQIQ